MNKTYVISGILAATILVAGMFAFIPIQNASTVHPTIGTNINDQDRVIHVNVNPNAAVTNQVIVPAGGNVVGRVTVTAEAVAGAAITCTVESTDGATTLATATSPAVAAQAEAATAAVDNTANTPPGFGANEGIQFDTSDEAHCIINIYLDSQTG